MRCLCVLTVLAPATALGQLPSGSDLLDRCQAAYAAVRSMEVDARTRTESLSATAHISFVRPGRLRVTGKSLTGPKYDLLINPEEIWLYYVGWTKQESIDSAIGGVSGVSGQTGTFVPPLLLGSTWGNLTSIKRYPITVAKETVGGRETYRLKATGPNTTMTVWLDARTYFLVRVVKDVTGGKQDIQFDPPKVNAPIPDSRFVRG